MIEYPLILLGGLLGSSHCVGMCGPFAITIGAGTSNWRTNLWRQSLYSLGRIFTYAFIGAMVAFLGMRIMHGTIPFAQGSLSCLAGVLLVLQGLHATGLWARVWKPRKSGFCPTTMLMKGFLTAPNGINAFLAGLLTGFLPCGLVYAFLALAASTGHVLMGMGTMAVFGLGTVPLMLTTGIGGSILSLPNRQRLLNVAGYCVLLTGLLTCYRGGVALHGAWTTGTANCPHCATTEAPTGSAN